MPHKPRRYLVVGGVDLFDRWGLAVTDEFTLSPPEPKTYQIDVPGADGCIDLTEALAGDVSFSNRTQTFHLLYCGGEVGFEQVKTALSNFLHGRAFAYTLSWDPGYTYTGRFSVDEYASSLAYGTVSLTVDAEPYKLRQHKTVRVAASGGTVAVLECGRKRQSPRVTCSRECVVTWDEGSVRLQAGSWSVPGLWITEGDNEVYVNSDLTGGDLTLGDWWGDALSEVAGKRLSELMWSVKPADTDAGAVYFDYDVMDL